jgi:hypothetical protein
MWQCALMISKEKQKSRDKRYKDSHKEQCAVRNKKYREANLERILARDKKYRRGNRDKQLAYMKHYYETHKEQHKAYMKEYRLIHKEEMTAYAKNYNSPTRACSAKIRESLGCWFCGEKTVVCLDYHHIDPSTKTDKDRQRSITIFRLGRFLDEVQKCVVICKNCHAKLHAGLLIADHLKPVDVKSFIDATGSPR